MLQRLRQFFSKRNILEVDTPILFRAAATDPHVESFTTHYKEQSPAHSYYLQTSPEFPMKRLLAAGSGSIYQVCKVFRQGEEGSRHHPEFTLLEWYHLGFDHHALMDEIEELVRELLKGHCLLEQGIRISYRDAFLEWADMDPHTAQAEEIQNACQRHIGDVYGLEPKYRDDGLNLLLDQVVVPRLPRQRPVFLYDFPVSQAALASIREGSPAVAERFEMFINGMELANGFHELRDAPQQRQRFINELAQRQSRGQTAVPIDELLLNALSHGLPDCAGVALGFDRLVMLASGIDHIDQVLAFPISRV